MSYERFEALIGQLCEAIDRPDVRGVLAHGSVEVKGFVVLLRHYQSDPSALYLGFNYGAITSGRSLAMFQLMLEANLTVYAQDQAQMGLDPDTGCALLLARVPMGDDIDGAWLAQTFEHYVEHGLYWRENMLNSPDEIFQGLCSGQYTWMKV
jgi:Tir chaperone protein (CesT) family